MISPCGLIMGYIKYPYQCKVRFFKDSDRETTVTWYPVPETRDRFMHYSRFHTGNYADARIEEWTGVGEVKGTKKTGPFKDVWHFDGKATCFKGTLDQFANGMSIHDKPPETPPCCAPKPVVLPDFVLEISAGIGARFRLIWERKKVFASGGPTRVRPVRSHRSSGGVRLRPNDRVRYAHHERPVGGTAIGGMPFISPARMWTIDDGMKAGGAAAVSPVHTHAPTGGMSAGGEAEATFAHTHSPDGGASLGGEITPSMSLLCNPEGGAKVGGEPIVSPSHLCTPHGGLSVGYTALATLAHIHSADGGLAVGGHADATMVSGATPDYTGCSQCPGGTFHEWSVTFAGCTGDLSGLNGTWAMTVGGFGCSWMGGLDPGFTLSYSMFSSQWELLVIGFAFGNVKYILAGGSWDCTGDNVLSFDSTMATGTHPSTVTVTGTG